MRNVLNVLWIKVKHAGADMPASHDSPMNKTVKVQNMNITLIYKAHVAFLQWLYNLFANKTRPNINTVNKVNNL